MAFVKLSATQVAILSNLSDNEVDTGPVFTEFVAAIKQQFGIPAQHKLKTGSSDHSDADYPTLYRKKTGERYEISPETGKWVGAAPTPVGPTTQPERFRYFPMNSLDPEVAIRDITNELDFIDGYKAEDAFGADVRYFTLEGYDFALADGELTIKIGESEF